MRKPANPYILTGEIVFIFVVVGTIGFFLHSYFKKLKTKKDEISEGEVAKKLSGNIGNIAGSLKNKSLKERERQQNSLKNFDVKIPADLIYNAHGIFDDDEDSVYSAFSKIETTAQLQLLELYFKKLYKKDLFTYIQNFLDASELAKVNTIIKKIK